MENEIAIFVSHRIDLDSVCVDQSIYHHMKCGAALAGGAEFVLDGDNTGDNISEKKENYSELTVQYWAWKNYRANYYGLCHYRRYLSFADGCFPRNDYNIITEGRLTNKTAHIHNLINSRIREQVEQYDVIVGACFDTTKIKRVKPQKSVLDLWLNSRNLVEPKTVYLTIKLIKELYPQYYESAMGYLNSKYYRGYNCYIMRKDLFYSLCQFQFDIMSEIEKRLDISNYTGNMLRAPGYMSELLLGTYIYHLQQQGCYRIKENPIVFFEDTSISKGERWIDSTHLEENEPKELAIFVSHRIDKKSETVMAPFYHHMRCGAIYDKSNSPIQGDNTKDNISKRRNTFCELTVQYWMWKNYHADYYGLCHYRRYFSFSSKKHQESNRGYIIDDNISRKNIGKYKLRSERAVNEIISNYDAVFPTAMAVADMDFLYNNARAKNVMDVFLAQKHLYENEAVYKTIEIVKNKYPEYYQSALHYLQGNYYHGYNCFIMNRALFYQMCQFEFDVLFELETVIDMRNYKGNMIRTPGYMSELLYGIFITWIQEQKCYKTKEIQLVFFQNSDKKLEEEGENKKMNVIKRLVKNVMKIIFPAYRVCIRIEQKLSDLAYLITTQNNQKKKESVPITITESFKAACFANELHQTHQASFAEFKGCHTGKSVVIIATGPSMKYYTPILNVKHIGVNAAFKNSKVKLDYYFTTDYENRNNWFQDLKNYDFIKFFGRYPNGVYRERFQIPESLFYENKARAFFQAAPSSDFHMNIEFYPLMGYFSIAFQAIHFALYTNAKKIYLVGCDCTGDGYFDGSKQVGDVTQQAGGVTMWLRGYERVKSVVERFYPETEIISVNPIGLRGIFHDVYTADFLADHPEIDASQCNLLTDIIDEES